MFDKYPNLYADLSAGGALRALQADPAVALTCSSATPTGSSSARDYYGGELLQFLSGLDLPQDVWRKIACENAERLIAEAGRGASR